MYCVRMLGLSITFLLLSACEAVFTEQPLGEQSTVLDKETWQGTWLSDGVVLMTTVVDAEKGVLQAAWLERGDEGARMESYTGFVRHTDDWLFLNMQQPTEDTEAVAGNEYFWARVDNNGQRSILWWPNVNEMRIAVNTGKLPGLVKEDKDVRLAPLNMQHIELINTPSSNLLNWAEPDIFVRIGD
jgi:hypothetical protein